MKSSDDDSRSYADKTRRDPNPIKRFIHRDRFNTAVRVFDLLSGGMNHNVLDFGAGDGELARLLSSETSGEVVAYEPAPTFQGQLVQNLKTARRVRVSNTVDYLPDKGFDVIFCLEVLEHLSDESIEAVLGQFQRLLKPTGYILVSVPHEIFFPALLKGMFRMLRRRGTFDGSARNIFRATLGMKVTRPMSKLSDDLPYFFDHLGFDYRALEKKWAPGFSVQDRFFRPFSWLGSFVNSEVFYILRKE